MDKVALRKIARAKRSVLQKSLPGFAESIANVDLHLTLGCIVAGYAPIASEADPAELMAHLGAQGHRLALPCTGAPGTPLTFRRWREGEPLIDGPFGTLQPDDTAVCVTPTALLIPMLAFDAKGWRLGYGGGYYDRTLSLLRARNQILAVGIAFSDQEIEMVPHEETDQPLDMVVTECGVRILNR